MRARHTARQFRFHAKPLGPSCVLLFLAFAIITVGVISRRTPVRPSSTWDSSSYAATLSAMQSKQARTLRLPPPTPPSKAASTVDSQQVSTSVYYSGKYWNDIPSVRTEVFYRRASGDPTVRWDDHLLRMRNGRPFKRALVFNAGNGWVERELMDKGIIQSAVGTDFLQLFVDEATATAKEKGYNATYVRVDINVDRLPAGPYDLVLNFAAAHHVARLDYVFLQINQLLEDDGLFVSMDYVGPHRNQYPDVLWTKLKQVNQRLPAHLRQEMAYPDEAAMLVGDPSEAQHSELIMPTLRRYFFVDLFRPLGGGIAYPLLTHNKALHAQPYTQTEASVAMVMEEDRKWLVDDEGRTFFAFVVARPLRTGLPDSVYQKFLLQHEQEREAGGTKSRYYTATRASSQRTA